MKFLKNTLLPIVIFISALVAIIKFFKTNKNDKSSDSTISSIINVLDTAFDTFGTFDSDLNIVITTLKKLDATQLKRLHKDFGYRLYNGVTGQYKIIEFFNYEGLTNKLDLNGIMSKEFDTKQLDDIRNHYKLQGLSFPLIS